MTSVIYIGASWCAPCKVIRPQIAELCKRNDIKFIEYDIEELGEEERDKITKIPTVTVLTKGSQELKTWNFNQVESFKNWLVENSNLQTDDF